MIGFVDVGGGTRGIFGAGVLDYCMDHGITGDLFVGVSAGSANGMSFISGQRGRNLVFYDEYAFRKEYMGRKVYRKTGSYIAFDYIYGTLSHSDGENPFDEQAFEENPMDMIVVATNAETGKPMYFPKSMIRKDDYRVICASCCVPVICKPYPVGNQIFFDGGISDPIPYKVALEAGCSKVVVILTRPKGAFRTAQKDRRMSRFMQRKYPEAAKGLMHRSEVYNRSLAEVLELERKGKVLVVAPDDIGTLKTLTQDHAQLEKMYRMGYEKAAAIEAFLKTPEAIAK